MQTYQQTNRFFIPLIALVIGIAGGYFIHQRTAKRDCISLTRCNLRVGMRKLWADHVVWTRDYIIAAIAQAPDTLAAAQRLLQNQQDIGAAVAQYYGNEAGDKLAGLLKDHILIAVDLIKAAQAKNDAQFKEIDHKWHDNAHAIAALLNSANPHNWALDDMVAMLNNHLQLTTQEVSARLQGKWDADIAAFDKIFNQMMEMADQLTNGIVAQFPHKF